MNSPINRTPPPPPYNTAGYLRLKAAKLLLALTAAAVFFAACDPPNGNGGNAAAKLAVSYAPAELAAVKGDAFRAAPRITPAGAAASFTVTKGGKLPAGLSLAPDGVISGTPSAAASRKNYTISASGTSANVKGQTVEINISLAVSEKLTVSYSSPSLTAFTGASFSAVPVINPPGASASFTLTEGEALPAGLSLAADGVISGRASAAASRKSYTIRASGSSADVKGQTAEITISLEVKNPAVLDSIAYGQGTSISTPLVLINGEPLTPAQLSGLEVKTTPPGLGADYSIKKKGDTRALPPADFKDATGLDFDPNTGRLSLEGASLKSGQAAAVTYEITAVPNASKGSRDSAPPRKTEITIKLAEPFSVSYGGRLEWNTGGRSLTLNPGTGNDGTELAKAYNFTIVRRAPDTSGNPRFYDSVAIQPTFTPAALTNDKFTYAIQAVDLSTGADLRAAAQVFNTKFSPLEFFPTDTRSRNNRSGKIQDTGGRITSTSPTQPRSAYKITITPKPPSIYAAKVVFITIEIR